MVNMLANQLFFEYLNFMTTHLFNLGLSTFLCALGDEVLAVPSHVVKSILKIFRPETNISRKALGLKDTKASELYRRSRFKKVKKNNFIRHTKRERAFLLWSL